MYDLSTSTKTQITADNSDQYSPVIFGDIIVWQDNRNGNWDIYEYNLLTSKEIRITTDEAVHYFPAIYGDRIVLRDYLNRRQYLHV